MGHWYFVLLLSLLLIFIGLFTHWSLLMAGALLPFIPMVGLVLRRRRDRLGSAEQEVDRN